ncbi:MAG: hypothetical protein ACYSU0_10895, partial [Planctomycetota bacterium]
MARKKPLGKTIKVRCPNPACKKVLAVKASLAGKKGRCPMCGQAMTIPKPPGAAKKAKTVAAQKFAETGPAAGAQRGKTVMLDKPKDEAPAPPPAPPEPTPEPPKPKP